MNNTYRLPEIRKKIDCLRVYYANACSPLGKSDSLLIAIAEYILDKEGLKEVQPECPDLLLGIIPPGYISIVSFCSKYIFVSPQSISRYCRQDREFRKNCVYKVDVLNIFWYVHEENTIEFLKKFPIYKNRIDRGIFKSAESKN
jgi:hypothetical protein